MSFKEQTSKSVDGRRFDTENMRLICWPANAKRRALFELSGKVGPDAIVLRTEADTGVPRLYREEPRKSSPFRGVYPTVLLEPIVTDPAKLNILRREFEAASITLPPEVCTQVNGAFIFFECQAKRPTGIAKEPSLG